MQIDYSDYYKNVMFNHNFIRKLYRNVMSASEIDLIHYEGQQFALKKIDRKKLFSPE